MVNGETVKRTGNGKRPTLGQKRISGQARDDRLNELKMLDSSVGKCVIIGCALAHEIGWRW
jgi:hypothetical protein